ncbi:LysR family transcriptional regulator [uncultured Parasutterella sp.]|uniref:LysR family transcriptional regulator n=1 Tax=uncultured Parasutterella sp. TaxID=1263098 RepID=UPI0025EAB9AB|nr:LysR family transcriptional regulator [uncultured Parasutterella sp.]
MKSFIQAQYIFCVAVREKSFSIALKTLRMGKSKANRLLNELEDQLGYPLFGDRNAGLPTQLGLVKYKEWYPSIFQLEVLRTKQGESPATLRFSFPYTTGSMLFVPITSRFAKKYPHIKFDIQLTSEPGMPVWYNMDLRVVHRDYIYENIKEYYLADIERIVCATPQWVREHPLEHPKDLDSSYIFGTREDVLQQNIKFKKEGREENIFFQPQIVCRNNLAALQSAILGTGVAIGIPHFLAAPYLENGTLLRIFAEWELSPLPLRAIVPNQKVINPIVEDWISYVKRALSYLKEGAKWSDHLD